MKLKIAKQPKVFIATNDGGETSVRFVKHKNEYYPITEEDQHRKITEFNCVQLWGREGLEENIRNKITEKNIPLYQK